MSQFQRYVLKKAAWFAAAFVAALILNFYLPRMVPGNPVDAIIAQIDWGMDIQQAISAPNLVNRFGPQVDRVAGYDQPGRRTVLVRHARGT